MWSEQQKPQRQDIGKPDFNAAAHKRAQVNLGQFFANTDDQPADDGAGHGRQAAQNHHRQRAQGNGGQRKLHPQLAAPDHAGDQRHHPGHTPHNHPDAVQRNANRLGRLVIVGHRAQRPAGGGFLEEHAQQRHQRGSNGGGNQVFLVDQHTPLEGRFENEDRLLGHADVDLVNAAAKQRLAQAFQEIGNAQRGHQQRGAFLVDQVAQHQPLYQPGDDKHHNGRHGKRRQVGQQQAGNAGPLRNPLGKARHRQRAKQHHRALRKIKHARGFEDQHKAQCDEGIQHARHQAAQQSF